MWHPDVATAARGQSGACGCRESSDGVVDAGMSIPGIAIAVASPKLAIKAALNSIGAHVDAHSDSAKDAEKERSDRSAATRRKRRFIIPN